MLRDVLVDGKIVKRAWKNPAPMQCPICSTFIPEAANECLVCKDLKSAEQRNRDRIENKREKCPTCGEVLVFGRCNDCNVQVTLG